MGEKLLRLALEEARARPTLEAIIEYYRVARSFWEDNREADPRFREGVLEMIEKELRGFREIEDHGIKCYICEYYRGLENKRRIECLKGGAFKTYSFEVIRRNKCPGFSPRANLHESLILPAGRNNI